MKITTKTTLILSLMITVFITSDIIVQKHFILPEFFKLEEEYAKNNLTQIESLIDETINQVDFITYDWSSWDDTYTFIQDSNRDYIESNFTPGTLENLRVDFILLFDGNSELVFGKTVAQESESDPIENLDQETLFASDELVRSTINAIKPALYEIDPTVSSDDQFTKGIFLMEHAPVIYSARPILDSEGLGPGKGFFVIGKFITTAFQEKLKEQLNLDFKIEMLTRSNENQKLPIDNAQYSFNRSNDEVLEVSKIVTSHNQPMLKISAYSSRDISKSGIDNINFALVSMLVSGLISILIVWYLLRVSLLKPITNLTDNILSISTNKDYSFRVANARSDEIGELAEEFNHLLSIIEKSDAELKSAYSLIKLDNERINSVSLELREANKELKRLSVTDALTGIPNRLCFEQKLQNDWNSLIRPQQPLSILMVDIDFFKLYNDHYGHQQGDVCIIQIASILEKCARRPSDMAARYGGEEFILILPGLNIINAQNLAENIQVAVAEAAIKNEASKVSEFVTVSIGISSVVPSNDVTIESLIRNADIALYQAKHNGRNRYESLV